MAAAYSPIFVGELIRFPVERRTQQRSCVSLLRQAKVLALPQGRTHVRDFAGVPAHHGVAVDVANGGWVSMPYGFSQGVFSFGEITVTDAKPNGAHPGTG